VVVARLCYLAVVLVVVLWLLDVGLTLAEFVMSLFGFLPEFTLPASPSFTIPVPLVGSVGVDALNLYLPTAVLVVVALVLGKALQFVYNLVPFKGT
jgi:hypothetical protein